MEKQTMQMQAELVQGTPEWFSSRLGKITSSNVGLLIGKGKGSEFTTTAMSYLFEVASERGLREDYTIGDGFEEYLKRTSISNKAMAYGTEHEAVARKIYSMQNENYNIVEVGFINAGFASGTEEIEGYGDSPDGVAYENESTEGVLEIKCPNPATFLKYKYLFSIGQTLKEIEPKYYWQCVSHIYCNGVQWCDFIYFDKMMKDGFNVVRIERNEADINLLLSRIKTANQLINSLLK